MNTDIWAITWYNTYQFWSSWNDSLASAADTAVWPCEHDADYC